MSTLSSQISKFYNEPIKTRLEIIQKQTGIDSDALAVLSGESGLTPKLADLMIENVVGIFGLPLGIALNFLINGKEILVPMAIEEPSVVAGASYMAKLARQGGGFQAEADDSLMIAQIQILDVPDLTKAASQLVEKKEQILEVAKKVDPVLVNLGGGPRDLEIRTFSKSPAGAMLVVHLIIDTKDAMGANAVNSAAERLTPLLEKITAGRVHLRILSNLADKRLARASCRIPVEVLSFGEFTGEQVRDGIVQAWAFAAVDPYRAATHNKGIMNGVDAVVIATGNDWRAVEAGAHAYAARDGRYTSLTEWAVGQNGDLEGRLEMPLAVGTIGGATRTHPTAKIALQLMGIKGAGELAEVIVSVGLAQNLAALRALATEGIQRGHMTLHARQVAIAAGAEANEIEIIADRIAKDGNVSVEYAKEIIRDLKRRQTTRTSR
ncbi:MAG: hydroxymethylglutaryl-CoA reductase, degradative [Anaerolineales bacterium]